MPFLVIACRCSSQRTPSPTGSQLQPQIICGRYWSCCNQTACHGVGDLLATSLRTASWTVHVERERVYLTGQATYFNLCRKFSLQPLPAPEQQLILFTANLSQRLSYASIKSCISAVRFLNISNGHPDPLAKKLKLDLLLRGLHRKKPSNQDKRLPITLFILEKIFSLGLIGIGAILKMSCYGQCAVSGSSISFDLANSPPSQTAMTLHGIYPSKTFQSIL